MIAVLMRGAIRGGRHRHSNGTRGGSDGKLHAKDGPAPMAGRFHSSEVSSEASPLTARGMGARAHGPMPRLGAPKTAPYVLKEGVLTKLSKGGFTEIEQTPRSQPRSRYRSQSQSQSQDGKLHSRTDQRSSKSQPGVRVKKATISEGLERRELE